MSVILNIFDIFMYRLEIEDSEGKINHYLYNTHVTCTCLGTSRWPRTLVQAPGHRPPPEPLLPSHLARPYLPPQQPHGPLLPLYQRNRLLPPRPQLLQCHARPLERARSLPLASGPWPAAVVAVAAAVPVVQQHSAPAPSFRERITSAGRRSTFHQVESLHLSGSAALP